MPPSMKYQQAVAIIGMSICMIARERCFWTCSDGKLTERGLFSQKGVFVTGFLVEDGDVLPGGQRATSGSRRYKLYGDRDTPALLPRGSQSAGG